MRQGCRPVPGILLHIVSSACLDGYIQACAPAAGYGCRILDASPFPRRLLHTDLCKVLQTCIFATVITAPRIMRHSRHFKGQESCQDGCVPCGVHPDKNPRFLSLFLFNRVSGIFSGYPADKYLQKKQIFFFKIWHRTTTCFFSTRARAVWTASTTTSS